MDGDTLFEILSSLREEALAEVVSPPEDRRSEFGYGRISGMLFAIERIRELINDRIEQDAAKQERFEREF